MSILCPLSDYTSVLLLDGEPLLPPVMTAAKRKEAQSWREKAVLVGRRLEASAASSRQEEPPSSSSSVVPLLVSEAEEESPVLAAFASRFGSILHVNNYLSGLSVPKSPPGAVSNARSVSAERPPTREEIRASIAELDKERDEALQRFLDEQARSLINLKKTYAEQRRRLLHQMNAVEKKPRGPSLSRLNPRQKAAFAKLSAMVKGYLVRRLMATLKVQEILNSLKDSLKMALQLHQEAARNQRSTESDVNLHKTLLQQINRDVRRFHDIFFVNSTQEKMKMIAQDREERKKEKPRKKFLSEATKQRMKQKMDDEQNKENRSTASASTVSSKKSPIVHQRAEKNRSSPRRGSNKSSPRRKKNIHVPNSS